MEGERTGLQRVPGAPDARAIEHDGPNGLPVVLGNSQIVGGEAEEVAGAARGLELQVQNRAIGEPEEQVGLLRTDA